jgi:hypothetical protein
MIGQESSPVVHSNDPITIFAKKKKMPAKKTATPEPQNELAYLQAEKQRIADAIKALKANEPSRLDRESTRPVNKVLPLVLGGMLARRTRAGQPRDEATTAILETCKGVLDAVVLE